MKTTAWKQIRNFLSDEEGATAVEYGIMVALIAAIIIAAVTGIGTKLVDIFEGVDGSMPVPVPPPAATP